MNGWRDLTSLIGLDKLPLGKLPVPGLGQRTLLELDLQRGVSETAPGSPIEALRAMHTPVLRAVVDGLERAARDDSVVGLVVHSGGWQPPLSQAEELHAAIAAFAKSGKKTLCWSESFGEVTNGTSGYLVASACEEIWLQPGGDLGLVGFTVGALFLRGALDKLSVEPQFGQRKEFKSAVDTFTQTELTGPHREMLSRIVESLGEQAVRTIAQARGLAEDAVRGLFDLAPLTDQEALEAGLVDRLGYRTQAYAAIREAVGDADTRYVERYRKAMPRVMRERIGAAVAVVPAVGPIHLGRNSGSPMGGRSLGSDSVGAALRAAAADDKVKAVVLRVDSPGGSAVASDAIRSEVLALRAAGKPVVASMGTVAASGGYYISMGADRIVAGAATLTGSIGVLAGKQVTAAGLARLGITTGRVSYGKYADMWAGSRPFTEDEWARLEGWLDRIYTDFTGKAAADRGLEPDALEAVAKGRVWTGADALERGLVDRIGGLSVAIEEACELASLNRASTAVRVFPKVGPLDRFTPPENSDAPTQAVLGEPAGPAALWERLVAALGWSGTGWQSHGVLTMPPLELR